jgi:hypothetical protein
MRTSYGITTAALAVCGMALAGAGPADHWSTVKSAYYETERKPGLNGMRFDVLVEREDGSRREVPVNASLHSGDRFWLRSDVREPVYV